MSGNRQSDCYPSRINVPSFSEPIQSFASLRLIAIYSAFVSLFIWCLVAQYMSINSRTLSSTPLSRSLSLLVNANSINVATVWSQHYLYKVIIGNRKTSERNMFVCRCDRHLKRGVKCYFDFPRSVKIHIAPMNWKQERLLVVVANIWLSSHRIESTQWFLFCHRSAHLSRWEYSRFIQNISTTLTINILSTINVYRQFCHQWFTNILSNLIVLSMETRFNYRLHGPERHIEWDDEMNVCTHLPAIISFV